MDAAWGPSRFGLSAGGPANPAQTELSSLHTPAEGGADSNALFSLENPVTAIALIAAATLGFAAFSTSVRVGHVTAKLGVGST